MNFGGPIVPEQAVLLPRLRGFPSDADAAVRVDAAHQERTERHAGGAGARMRLPAILTRRERRFLRAPSIRFRRRSRLFQEVCSTVCRNAGLSTTGLNFERLLGTRLRLRTTRTKAICAWIISRIRTARGFCASATARRRASIIRTIPLPLDGQTNGNDPRPRPAGGARLHAPVRRQQNTRRPPWPIAHQGRQVHTLDRAK